MAQEIAALSWVELDNGDCRELDFFGKKGFVFQELLQEANKENKFLVLRSRTYSRENTVRIFRLLEEGDEMLFLNHCHQEDSTFWFVPKDLIREVTYKSKKKRKGRPSKHLKEDFLKTLAFVE